MAHETDVNPGGALQPPELPTYSRRLRFAVPFIPLAGAEVTASVSMTGTARLVVLVLIPLSTFLAAVTGSAYALIEAKRTYARDFRVALRAKPGTAISSVRLPSKFALRLRVWLATFAETAASIATAISVITADITRGEAAVNILVALIAVITAFVVTSYPEASRGRTA